MIIDTVNISTYNLTVLTVKDYLTLPARKEVLDEPEFDANDIKLQAWDFTIELGGKWNTLTGMNTSLTSFKTLLEGNVKHTIEIPEYSIPETTDIVFKSGFQVDFLESNGVMIGKLTIKATVTNSNWIAA